MRLPEMQAEWQVRGWKVGLVTCPGIPNVGVWWDGNPFSFAISLPFINLRCERDGGRYWPWDWTILRVVIGKQEFRTDLALNNWSLGIALFETDDWSLHIGPIDIECEYDKFYDVDDDWIRPADLRLFSKVREKCECERDREDDGGQHARVQELAATRVDQRNPGLLG